MYTQAASADVITMAEQLQPQQPSLKTPHTRNATHDISKKLPNKNSIDIQMKTSKAVFVANSKLSTNSHLVRICPEDGYRRNFLFFIIPSEIIMS